MRWFFDLVTAIFRRRRQRRMDLLRYWDGTGWRYGDPFLLYRKLWSHPELNIEAQAPLVDAGQEPETTIFVTALAEIFGVERWDPDTGRGLTDWEVLDCFQQLNEYMVALKKIPVGRRPRCHLRNRHPRRRRRKKRQRSISRSARKKP